MSTEARATPTAIPRASTAKWRWSNWSLTQKVPFMTAAIVAIVVATSLALTYSALKRSRVEASYDRLRRVARQIAISSEQTTRARMALLRQVAGDSAVRAALRQAEGGAAPREGDATWRAVSDVLLRLRIQPDSSLPIELWTTNGRRLVHVGQDIRGDSSNGLRPELRALNGRPVTEIPVGRAGSDSIQYGAFYRSDGRTFFWTIAPILAGQRRIGYLAQQRVFRTTTQQQVAMREIIGNDAALNLHNVTDRFWANYGGDPIDPLAGVDTTVGDFIGERPGVGKVIASEAAVPLTPWIFSLEAPLSSVLAEPLATLRRLALINLLIAAAGIIAAWLVSRRLTQPLVTLTSMSDAIARGDYSIRMQHKADGATKNEVTRLSATFNRMADEIEASHRELGQQVEEALAVSQQLEMTNEDLVRTSADAEDARRAAEQANRAKSDFLAVMSHELRTPLNAIGGYTEILQMGIYGEVSEKQRNALQRIARSQQMLLSLINDVLSFAKLDAGQVKYTVEDVPLTEVLPAAEPLVAPQLEAKELRYSLEGCDAGILVRADREKLTQIVLNLLSNAIKFTPSKGTVTVACDVGEHSVRIHVRDTGVGIPDDRLESIFDPFMQVDRALNRPHDGVGLGLSISRDLARGMGGTLTVASDVGSGSTFTLTLRKA